MTRRDIEKQLGELSRMLDPTRLLTDTSMMAGLPAVFYFTKNRAWLIETEATSEAEAERLGKRAQSKLTGKAKLSASDPYLHHLPLYVVYDGGVVKLEGTPEKSRTPSVKSKLKRAITKRGKDFFGARGFSLSGSEGAYVMEIKPYLKQFRGVFSTARISVATLEEAQTQLEGAIAKLEGASRNPGPSVKRKAAAGPGKSVGQLKSRLLK